MPAFPRPIVSIEDLRRVAARKLPRPIFEMLDGGADDESTLRANTEAFSQWDLLPRALTGVGAVSTTTRVLGEQISLPLVLSPTGTTRLFHHQGEAAVARAASRAGVLYTLSTVSTLSIEQVAAASGGPRSFQLYAFRDRGLTREFVSRAREAGYSSLVVTVDMPVSGNRERDRRNGLTIPPRPNLRTLASMLAHPGWLSRYLFGAPITLANVTHRPEVAGDGVTTAARFVAQQFDATMTWRDVEEIAAQWGGPLAVKGLLAAQDAQAALDAGATAIIVSNHGGRQLDGAVAAISALPRIVDAVAGRAEILLDGGVRRGTHVLKALALGATACMVGRPYLYGLAADGEAGVLQAIDILRSEIERGMILLGVAAPNAIGRDHVQENCASQQHEGEAPA